MRLVVRTFLWFFVPLALLLAASFWAVQHTTVAVVHDALRTSFRHNERSISQMRERRERQNRRYLTILAENAALRAGLQLLLGDRASAAARMTVEDQLGEISAAAGIDFLVVASGGVPLAGVVRQGSHIVPIDLSLLPARPPARGYFPFGGVLYQISPASIDQADENLAMLLVGEREDLSEFNTPVVLLRGGKVVRSTLVGVDPRVLEPAIARCHVQSECELEVAGEAYLSLAATTAASGPEYSVRSLLNLDSAVKPVQATLRKLLLVSGAARPAAALLMTLLSSFSVVKPIQRVVAHLRQSELTGTLAEFDVRETTVREIRELVESFNRAACSIREGRLDLHRAYVEFVGSLASALDARDPYTAGHSERVCRFSCAIAAAMNFDADRLDQIRIGALLHDIGKIGIPDAVLQKADRLTSEEFRLIQQHPEIGKRILEGVHGFAPYLSIVELHHENWDGSGYPWGQRGEQTPLTARIVHVADAYDAMTSDRPYRRGMNHQAAMAILHKNAGSQFDPVVVEVFAMQAHAGDPGPVRSSSDSPGSESLFKLAQALTQSAAPADAHAKRES